MLSSRFITTLARWTPPLDIILGEVSKEDSNNVLSQARSHQATSKLAYKEMNSHREERKRRKEEN